MLSIVVRRFGAFFFGTLLLGVLASPTRAAASSPRWNWLSPKPQGFALNYASFPKGSEGFLVGAKGSVLHSSDGGNTFQPQDSGTEVDLFGVFFLSDALTGWAVGDLGTILHTSDGGQHWAPQNSTTNRKLKAVLFTDAQHGFAVGEFRTLLTTSDGGQTWTGTAGQILTLNAIAFPDASHGFIVGWAGGVLRTANGGATWTQITTPTTANLLAVSFFDVNHGWAVGTGGAILRTTDDGLTWQLAEEGSFGDAGPPDGGSPDAGAATDLDLVGVVATGTTAAYAVGSGVGIFGFLQGVSLTTTDGTGWLSQPQYFGNAGVTSIAPAPDGSAWACTGNGHLYHAIPGYAGLPFPYFFDTNNGGLYNDVPAMAFADSQNGVVAGGYYSLYFTNNGGATFSYALQNIYFMNPDGGATPNGAPSVKWQAVDMPTTKVAFAAGTFGSIAFSKDSGQTWAWVPGAANFPQTVDFYSIQMLDPFNGFACGSNGTIVQTTDGFATFTTQEISSGILRAIHFRTTGFGMVVGDFGQIFTTQNGGANWRFASTPSSAFGDLYGLSVVTPVLAYAVGKGGLLLVSFDDGQSWLQSASPTLHDLTQVVFTTPNDGYVTTAVPGEILATRDATLTWEHQFNDDPIAFLTMQFVDPAHGFVGGTAGTVLATATAGELTCQQSSDCYADGGAVAYRCDLDAGGICTACNTNQLCGPNCSPCPVATPFCWGGFCGECHQTSDCSVNGPGPWSCQFGTCISLVPPDAGPPDAGPDAGADAGAVDAGFDGGSMPDGGTGDAGSVDGGCQAPDGAPIDCAVPASSGCGCSPVSGAPADGGLLVLLLAALFFLPLRLARR